MHSVSVKDLNLSFGSVDVLQNLNIDINDGEFLVLLGSSGCGKSTLLNCIAGLLDITLEQRIRKHSGGGVAAKTAPTPSGAKLLCARVS